MQLAKSDALLSKLEKRIEANTKAAWRENGLIMLFIRDKGLYKKKYKTFENYLDKRWDYSARYGRMLISGVEFLQKLEYCSQKDSVNNGTIVPVSAQKLPVNEAQIRPLLTGLNHDGELAEGSLSHSFNPRGIDMVTKK